MKNQLFTSDNTEGYSLNELTALNDEWEQITINENIEVFTDEYYTRAQQFSDEIASR